MDLDEFRNHLRDLVLRIKADKTWFDMTWANRYHLNSINYKFEEVISKLVKLPDGVLPHKVWVLLEGGGDSQEHIYGVYGSEEKVMSELRRIVGNSDINELGGRIFKYEYENGQPRREVAYYRVLKREVMQ